VVHVATTATARVRELPRGGHRKNDGIDASVVASLAALHGDTAVVTADDDTTVFALLEERRATSVPSTTRADDPPGRDSASVGSDVRDVHEHLLSTHNSVDICLIGISAQGVFAIEALSV